MHRVQTRILLLTRHSSTTAMVSARVHGCMSAYMPLLHQYMYRASRPTCDAWCAWQPCGLCGRRSGPYQCGRLQSCAAGVLGLVRHCCPRAVPCNWLLLSWTGSRRCERSARLKADHDPRGITYYHHNKIRCTCVSHPIEYHSTMYAETVALAHALHPFHS